MKLGVFILVRNTNHPNHRTRRIRRASTAKFLYLHYPSPYIRYRAKLCFVSSYLQPSLIHSWILPHHPRNTHTQSNLQPPQSPTLSQIIDNYHPLSPRYSPVLLSPEHHYDFSPLNIPSPTPSIQDLVDQLPPDTFNSDSNACTVIYSPEFLNSPPLSPPTFNFLCYFFFQNHAEE